MRVCVCVCVYAFLQSQLKIKDLHTVEAPREGSSLTVEDNDSDQRDQIDKDAKMLAASTDTPGSSTHVK